MPRTQNQKLKILHIMQFLLRQTDEEHPATVPEIITYLEENSISAERKSIYSDLEALKLFGVDIEQAKGTGGGYYVAAREFELPELKLLVDSVQASKFITQKKSMVLIKKIEGLASSWQAKQLHGQVYVTNRIKTMNESIYYNVDKIHSGIAQDCKIRFRYFEYSVGKERVFKHNGRFYAISPLALTWDDENYYMVGYDAAAEKLKHYRVDKMEDISLLNERRQGVESFCGLDPAAYAKGLFGMFSGEEERVTLRVENPLAGAVIDRFGKEAILVPNGSEHFTVKVSVVASPQFFGWLCGFGSRVKIMEPPAVLEKMENHIAQISELYQKDKES